MYEKVLDLVAKQTELPGFRPGKAPQRLIESTVGKGKIWNETLERLLPTSLFEALQGEGVSIIDVPRYNVTQYGEDKDLTYTVTFAAFPQVEVKDYAKVRVKKVTPKKVESKQIEEVVQNLFKKWREQRSEKQSDAEEAKAKLVDAAGNPLFSKPAQNTQLPDAPTDNFAKTVGAKDLADLREQVRKELEARAEFEAEKEYEDKLLAELEKRTKVELPDILVQDELDRMLARLSQTLEQVKSNMEAFLQAQGKTVENLQKQWREQAERNVKVELILQEIGKQERIEVTEQEIGVQLQRHEPHEGHDEQRERTIIAHALCQAKTLAWLKEHAAK